MRCTLFLPENSRLLSETRLLFFSPAILCWPRATFLTSYVILAMSRITISSYFHLPGSRNLSWQRPFPRLTMRLPQRSHTQLPLRMFINLPPTMESFSVNGWFCRKELVMNSDTDRMMGMITGYWVTQLLHAAATFSFADHLAKGAATVEDIARAEGTDPSATFRLLRSCAS